MLLCFAKKSNRIMNIQKRKDAFVQLGLFFSKITVSGHSDFENAYQFNNWFTFENISIATKAWSLLLTKSNLDKWLSSYTLQQSEPKTVAIIMAGNIPLVGFHDLLCVLITGNKSIIKFSEDDKILPKLVIDELIRIEPEFTNYITISDERLPKDFDAVIATGSNNTNRYFEYYFRNKAALLRKNRTSVAVLTGTESADDLQKLGGDIFTYFGLGCRNVSKIYVPESYDLATFFESIEHHSTVLEHHKYTNNYNYHKAIFLLNLAPHLDNNFIVVKEDESLASPLGTLFYERYSSLDVLNEKLKSRSEDIQCVVGYSGINGAVNFGKAQSPELWDYADGVDTIDFLNNL